MAGQLAYAVEVIDEHGSSRWFRPGDTVPDWAVDQITNPDAWDVPPTSGADQDGGNGGGLGEPKPYSKWTVDELNDEVDRRNDEREDEDDHVVVEGKGNKPDLVAALEADDAAQSEN